MATSNRRDVKLTLSVDTLGEDGVKRLQSDILALAKEAGDAAPEFERLATEVGQLGAQADAVRGLDALLQKVDALKARQDEAATAAANLRERLEQQQAATRQAAADQQAAAAAYTAARTELSSLNGQLTVLRNTYDASGNRVENYKQELQRLTEAKVAQKAVVDQTREALRQESTELRESEAAQNKLQTAYDKTEKSVERLGKQIAQQAGEIDRTKKSVDALGLSAEDLGSAQAALVQRVAAANAAIAEQQAAMARAAAAAREMAEEDRLAAIQAQTLARQREQAQQEVINLAIQEAEARQTARAAEARVAAEREAEIKRQAALEQQAQAELIKSLNATIALRRQQAAEATRLAQQQAAAEKAAAADAAAAIRAQAEANSRAVGALAQKLRDDFAAVGARSIGEIVEELNRVEAAMRDLQRGSQKTGVEISGAMASGKARVAELQREIREVTGQLTLADRAADLFKNSLGQIAAGNLIADAIGSLVERVKELGRQFILVNVQAESMRRGLTALYGSVEIAQSQMNFLRQASIQAGVSMSGLSDAFVRFSAATKSSGIPLEQTNALFQSLTQAGATLGLSTERVQLALDALGQIASKGVVSMEELRQQLGDSVPGALSLTAKGLGITDAELVKLVESGRLASRDFFPAFTRGLKELQGETDGLVNTLGRFKTALTSIAQGIGEAGGLAVLNGALKVLGGLLGAITLGLSTLAEGLFTVGRAALVAFEAFRGNGKEALEFFNQESEKAVERLRQQADAFNAMLNPAGEAARRVAAVAEENRKQQEAARFSNEELARTQTRYREMIDATQGFETSSRAAASAMNITAGASEDLSAKYVKLGVDIAQLQSQQEADIVVRGKQVKAAKETAEALVQVADLRDNEVASAEAAVRANTILLDATRQEAAAREVLASTLALELQEKTKLAIQQDGTIALRKQELDQIAERLDKAKAEADVAREEVRNLEASRAAIELKRQALRDNSTEVDRFRAAMVTANNELETSTRLFKQGKITAEEFAAAETRAATAAALYVDALRDQQRTLEANTRAKRAAIDLTIAGLQVALEEARSDEVRAQRLGRERDAREALIRQKQIELEIARLMAEAQRIEADGAIAIAKAKLEEARATGTLTESKRLELELEIKLNEVKLRQADARDRVVQRMREEISFLERTKSGLTNETKEVDKNTESWEANAAARKKAAENELTYNKDGFRTNADGSVAQYEVADDNFVPDALPNGQFNTNRLTQGEIKRRIANRESLDGFGVGIGGGRIDVPGGIQIGGRGGSTGTASSPAPAPAPAPRPTSVGAGYNVTVNLNGASTRIATASQQDADNLARLFTQLETAAGRGG